MRDLFLLDNMVTPRIITIIYWILLAMALLSGLGIMFSGGGMGGGMAGGGGISFGSILSGLLSILVGALFARIFCELTIVLFRINEALQDLRQRDKQS